MSAAAAGPLFHLTTRAEWLAAQVRGRYEAESLHTEGFIHLSSATQVEATGRRHYAGRTDLVILEIDPARLTWDVRYEEAHGELYPHLYGPVDLPAVISVQTFST